MFHYPALLHANDIERKYFCTIIFLGYDTSLQFAHTSSHLPSLMAMFGSYASAITNIGVLSEGCKLIRCADLTVNL